MKVCRVGCGAGIGLAALISTLLLVPQVASATDNVDAIGTVGATTASLVAAGSSHTCAVLDTGAVTCWGRNFYGELGNSTNNGTFDANPTPSPVALPAGTTAVSVTAGNFHTCAVLDTGAVTCWGYNRYGQLGNSTTSGTVDANPTPLPVALPAGTTATALTAGFNHTCAVLDTGAVTCWGRNQYGQLGNSTNNGTNDPNPTPLPVALPAGATATALHAGYHTCAILDTGAVTCWGYNQWGQLGSSTNNGTSNANPTPSPVALPAGTTATTLTAGTLHTCAVLDTGAVTCWGNNRYGQLGSSTNNGTDNANPTPSPVALPAGTTATALTADRFHTCAVLNTGAVTCWGRNQVGQLGNSTNNGTNNPNPTPLPVALPSGATATSLTAGDFHTCAVLDTGAVTCWGFNLYGALGNSTNSGTDNANPTPLPVALTPLAPTAKSIPPRRVLESRSGNPDFATFDGLFQGTGRTAAGQIAEVRVAGRGGVPADAEAVFLNVVAVSPSGPGYLTVFPCGITPPVAANVNYNTGDIAANAVLAKIGADGKVCVFTHADTDLVIDINGYTPAGAGTKSVPPRRVLESRSGNPDFTTFDGLFQGTGRTAAGQIAEVRVAGRGGVPADAEAVFLNVVAVSPSGPGYLTVFPCGITPPVAANVNYNTGDIAANAVLAKIGADGKVCVFTHADTDLVIDINGYTPAGAGTKSVPPRRVLESRSGNPDFTTFDGLFQGTGRTAAGQIAEVRVAGRGGVPADAEAVFLNVVAVSPSGPGYLTVFPCGITPPVAANVNYNTGDIAANAVLAKIGADGKVCVFTHADTDLVIDINGHTPATTT